MCKYPEHTVRLTDDCYVWRGSYFARSGSNDYTRDVTDIESIEDASGAAHHGRWTATWSEAFPGVETRKAEDVCEVRVHRSACPVRLLVRNWFEYASFDGSGPVEQSTKWHWVRVEL